jgi:hypothetical protein
MNTKYIELKNCTVLVDIDGKVRISTMSESIELSAKEWGELTSFVTKTVKPRILVS